MKKLLLVLALVATVCEVTASNKKTAKQPVKKAAVHTHQGLVGEQTKLMELCHRHGRDYISAPGKVGKCSKEAHQKNSKSKQQKARSNKSAYKSTKGKVRDDLVIN